jgi:hypothetical protein
LWRSIPVIIEELDRVITTEELLKAVISRNRNKSPDIYDIVADFFIDAKEVISLYLIEY